MNYIQQSFHPATKTATSNLPDDVGVASSNNCVRFNDLMSTPRKCNDREKYLTA
jgi:hypothetical protein